MPQEGVKQDQNVSTVSIHSKTIKPSPSWTNPRKRPHHTDLTSLFEPIADDDGLRSEGNGSTLHAPKRNRGSQWPLKDSHEAPCSRTGPREDGDIGQNEKRSSYTSIHGSKFQEGSMNDKVSQRPPSPYTKDEEAMEKYVKSQGLEHSDTDTTYSAGIEPMKHSGMFRFSKVIVNTFNRANIWQGINGIWKEKEKENKIVPEKNVLQERQAKAIEAYAELKKSGFKGTKTGLVQREFKGIPAIKFEDAENESQESFRDSGIDVDGYRSSTERKSSSQTMDLDESLKLPPLTNSKRRSASPFSNPSSGRKSSLHFRKPSFQNLKKVKSQIRLPSAKKSIEAPFSPSLERDDAMTASLTGPGLRRQPSKKDISRQSKLTKKVSDLENKLSIARQELELSMSTAPPVPDLPTYLGRKAFVPGGLSSLPSERNMTPQQIADHGGPALAESRQTADQGRTSSERLVEEPQLAYELEDTPTSKAINFRSATTRRGVRDVNKEKVQKLRTDIDEISEGEGEEAPASQSKSGRHMKPQGFKKVSSHSPAGTKKRKLPKVPVKTPQNSPSLSNENAPPIPAVTPTFDPLAVDQAKIISMRTTGSKALFGALAEDLINLHKDFPKATEHDLVEYLKTLGWQPRLVKTTDHTSVAHENRPESPFLGRPSTSPMRTRSKNSKRGISPPPPSLSSARKLRFEPYARGTPTRRDSLPSKAPLKKYHEDKPLPEIQKEEFEWDEDVF